MKKYYLSIIFYLVTIALCADFSVFGELTEEKYLRQKFQNYSQTERCARWLPNDSIVTMLVEHGINFADGDMLITTVLSAYDFIETNCAARYYVFATSTATNYCHLCFPEIGITKFVKQQSAWKLQLEDFFVTQAGGGYGTNPSVETISCGENAFCTILHGDYFAQDIGYETVSLIIENNGRFNVVFSGCIAGDGEIIVDERDGATQKFKFTGTVEFIPTKNAKFYDLRVTMKGSKPVDTQNNVQIITFDEQKTYYFDGSMYIERQK